MKRDRIVLAISDRAAVVPLERFQLSDEPWLDGDFAWRSGITLGETLSIPIKFRNADNIELVEAPDGLTLSDGKITWKPTSKQAGNQVTRIRLSLLDRVW